MMRIVPSATELPAGSHSISLYASRPEAAHHIARFLKGADERQQAAVVFTADDEMMNLYRDAVETEAPQMVGALRRITGLHVRGTTDGYRPIETVDEFANAHPDGASMCGDTIPSMLDRRTLASVLTYEDWFDGLRPFYHRGLCPYDLNHFPVREAPAAFERLSKAHTHGVLSADPNPASQFLQLLILPYVENPPEAGLAWLARAVDRGLLVERDGAGSGVDLTPRGEGFVSALRALPALTRDAAQVVQALEPPGAGR